MNQPALLDLDPHARRGGDFYVTPRWMTRALLARYPIPEHLGSRGRVLEPCVGNGAILRLLSPELDVVTNDLVPRAPVLPDFLEDARLAPTWDLFEGKGPIAVVITNPPFDASLDIVRHAVERATCGVAMLLRISWLEPTDDRSEFLAAHPPTRQIVLPRWKFRGAGSGDFVTCCWFLWAKQRGFCDAGIEVVTKAERDHWIGIDRIRGLLA